MSYTTYRIWKAALVVILAGLVGWTFVQGNPWVPIPAALAAMAILILMRKGVKEIVEDERSHSIANHAARVSYQFGVIGMALIGATLGALARGDHPELQPVADTLVFGACGFLVIYLFGILYYSGKLGGGGPE